MKKLIGVLVLFLLLQVGFLYLYKEAKNVSNFGVDVRYSERYHELRAKGFLTQEEYNELNKEIEDYKRRFDEAIQKDVARWKKENGV